MGEGAILVETRDADHLLRDGQAGDMADVIGGLVALAAAGLPVDR